MSALPLGSTSVTLDRPGRVLVQLHGTFSVTCGAGSSCDRTVAVTIAGKTTNSPTKLSNLGDVRLVAIALGG